MTPGQYLQKRRAASGYSLRALARDLAMVDGFGRTRGNSEIRGLHLHLNAAEEDVLILPLGQLQLIANYVPIDIEIYRELVDLAERRIGSLTRNLCRSCGATEHTLARKPFSGLPGNYEFFVKPDLCSECARTARREPPPEYATFTIVDDDGVERNRRVL